MRTLFKSLSLCVFKTSVSVRLGRLRMVLTREPGINEQELLGVVVSVRQRKKVNDFVEGTFSLSDTALCAQFAQEKMARLDAQSRHWSSAQSRDPELKQYKGAIRTPDRFCTISVSGLSEDLDEILALAIAVDCHLMTLERALWIANSCSGNPHADLLSKIV